MQLGGRCKEIIECFRYWLACSASEIYAARSSIVGSIGVIGGGFGFVEVAEKIGVRKFPIEGIKSSTFHFKVERRVFTAGKCKSQMDPFQPLKEDDVARQQVRNKILRLLNNDTVI